MYLNPYYRHIQDLKRTYARSITTENMIELKDLFMRKARRGNLKAAELLLIVLQWQKELDVSLDTRHELQSIMGSPTDGLMKRIRPGMPTLLSNQMEEEKQQA